MAEEPRQENRDPSNNEDNLPRGRLIGFSISGAIVLVVLLWVWVNPSDPTEKKDFIQAVGMLLAALAGLGGLYFTRENTEKQLRQARKSQEQTQRLTERGQITDRFTRAIDQLGKTDGEGNRLFEIRIGGIYALERIARESEEDHWPIMEVLTAYVRQHAHSPREEGQGDEADAAIEKESVEDSSGESETTEVPTPDPDIQAIMTVLGRRTRSFGEGEPEALDLHETRLSKANLWEANLKGANLSGADLSRAYLTRDQLEEARGDKNTQLPPVLKPPAH
jgi:Pentapeptide repeats (8 copies)